MKPKVLSLAQVRSNHEDDNPLTPNPFMLGKPFCNVPGAVFHETITIKNFGCATGEAETSADFEEATNRVCSFVKQTTENDIS